MKSSPLPVKPLIGPQPQLTHWLTALWNPTLRTQAHRQSHHAIRPTAQSAHGNIFPATPDSAETITLICLNSLEHSKHSSTRLGILGIMKCWSYPLVLAEKLRGPWKSDIGLKIAMGPGSLSAVSWKCFSLTQVLYLPGQLPTAITKQRSVREGFPIRSSYEWEIYSQVGPCVSLAGMTFVTT